MIQTPIQTLIPLIKDVVTTDKVLDHLPLQPDMTLMAASVAYDDRLHFYTVTRPLSSLALRGANLNHFDHRIHIEGRIAYQGSVTQQLIDNEMDSILEMLAANPTINNTVEDFQAIRLPENRPYAFYNQAVHYSRIELEVRT